MNINVDVNINMNMNMNVDVNINIIHYERRNFYKIVKHITRIKMLYTTIGMISR